MEEQIKRLWFEDGQIKIQTDEGRTLSHRLEVFPSLLLATPAQRENYYLWDNNRSIRWDELDEDIHISHFYEPETVDYGNEVNQLFLRFPEIDMKAVANRLGMHWTKLARFRYGVWTPSAEILTKIKNGIMSMSALA